MILSRELNHSYTCPLAYSPSQDFSPLELCSKMAPLLEKLGEASTPMSQASPVKDINLTQYTQSLKTVTVLRLLKQLSEVRPGSRLGTLMIGL